MSDDRKKTAGNDRKEIAVHEDYEVAYWTKELGVSKEKLQEAVDKVGNTAAKVREYLGK